MRWPATSATALAWVIAIAALLVAALLVFRALRMRRLNGRLGAARAKRGWKASVKEFLAELRHRGVLKVAAVYVAIGWAGLEGLHSLFLGFDAPHWAFKVVATLVFLGFPVVCLMAGGFEITPEGIRPAPKSATSQPVVAEPMSAAPAEAHVPPSIAVLPFADVSADRDQQFLGEQPVMNIATPVRAYRV